MVLRMSSANLSKTCMENYAVSPKLDEVALAGAIFFWKRTTTYGGRKNL